MKVRDYLAIAQKNIRRQKVRSSLTIIAMAISATILVTLTAISLGMQQAVKNILNIDNSLTSVIVTPNKATAGSLFGGAQKISNSENKLDELSVEKIKNIENVSTVAPATHIWEFHSFVIEGSDEAFATQAQGIVTNEATQRPLAAGEFFQPDDERRVVIIGYTYAKELGFGDVPQMLVGKKLTVTTQNGYIGEGASLPRMNATEQELKQFAQTPTKLEATIIGVTQRGSDENTLFIPMHWARQVRAHHSRQGSVIKTDDQITKDGYTHLYAKVDASQHVQQVMDGVDDMGFGATSTLAQLNQLMQVSTIIWVGLGAVSLIALIAASLGVVNTMLMSVTEQRYAIGVWRACGARRLTIAQLFLAEACLLGLCGGVIGVGLSFIVAQLVNRQIALLLTAQNLAIVDVVSMPWWLLFGGVGLTVLFGAVSGLYPAYRAAKQDPSAILAQN